MFVALEELGIDLGSKAGKVLVSRRDAPCHGPRVAYHDTAQHIQLAPRGCSGARAPNSRGADDGIWPLCLARR